MPEIKKKSLRDKLNQPDNMFNEPAYGAESLPPEPVPPVNQKPQPFDGEVIPPIVAKEDPAPEAQVTPSDEKMAMFLTESQTMDGPEKGKVAAESVPSPEEFGSFYKKWKQVPTSLSANDKKMFQDKLSQLDQKMIEAEEEYKANKNRLEWAEVAEQLGHMLVQFMAAAEGSRSGFNGTGLKPDKVDWEKRLDRALREFDSRKDTLAKQQGAVSRELEKAEGKAERGGRDEQKLLERDFFTTQAKIQADAKRAAAGSKDDATKERQAREKARMYIANYESAEDAVNKLSSGQFKDDKEKQKLQNEITDSLRKNGHIGVSKDLSEGGQGGVEKTGGVLGFFQSDDYNKMQKYISANKKRGVESVYQGYGVQVPEDVKQALLGQDQPAATEQKEPPASNEVERQTADGKTAVFDVNTKKFLRYK